MKQGSYILVSSETMCVWLSGILAMVFSCCKDQKMKPEQVSHPCRSRGFEQSSLYFGLDFHRFTQHMQQIIALL